MTEDRSVADDFLDAYPERPRRIGGIHGVGDLLIWLIEHGGLTDRQSTQLRHLFSAGFENTQLDVGTALWQHAGPAAATELLTTLRRHLDNDFYGPRAMRTFAAMGTHARPILPHLDQLIGRRRRVGVDLSDADEQLRADEQLLTAAVTTRQRIVDDPDSG